MDEFFDRVGTDLDKRFWRIIYDRKAFVKVWRCLTCSGWTCEEQAFWWHCSSMAENCTKEHCGARQWLNDE